MNISFIGAGNFAANFGRLFKNSGHQVYYGTRNPKNDQITIDKAIGLSDVVFLAIPYTAKRTIAEKFEKLLTGKIIVDATNPLYEDWSPLVLGAENSSGEETTLLLPDSKVVKAFNTIFADMTTVENQLFGKEKLTVFICGNNENRIVLLAGWL